MTSKIAVFLVDDHALLRAGLKLLINAQPDMYVVGEVDDTADIEVLVRASGAKVVVMDVSMPRVGGSRATARLKSEQPEVVIIALTRHTERAYVQLMLASGATGYVLKQSPATELISAIRTSSRGGIHLDPLVAGKLIPRDAFWRGCGTVAGPALLSEREQEVSTMIALGYTNKETATTLGISVKTVETHKSRIMEKLEMTSRAELVRFALLQGWLDPGKKH